MTEEEEKFERKAGPADFLANERTFLAWVRTSIALMGFGFVIVKFALFVRQVSILTGNNPVDVPKGYSGPVGIAIVILGAVVSSFAFFRYIYIERQLRKNQFFPSKILSILTTVFLFIAGVILVIYLWPVKE